MSESQRAMVAGRIANIQRGEVGGGYNHAEGQIRLSDAAELLNISRTGVVAAKTVLRDGTPEEIAAVESGEVAVSTIA